MNDKEIERRLNMNPYAIVDAFEKHHVLERNESNPDAGIFAAVPDDLKEIL